MLGRKSNPAHALKCSQGSWSAIVTQRSFGAEASEQHTKRQKKPLAPRSKALPPISVIRAALLETSSSRRGKQVAEKQNGQSFQRAQPQRFEKIDFHEALMKSAAQWSRNLSNNRKKFTRSEEPRNSQNAKLASKGGLPKDLVKDRIHRDLENADTFEDIIRGLAVALQAPVDSSPLEGLSESILEALGRCVQNSNNLNPLTALNALCYLIRNAGHPIPAEICVHGMLSAAANASVHALQRYLSELIKQGGSISTDSLRQILRQLNVQSGSRLDSKFLGGKADALCLLTGESHSNTNDNLESTVISLRGFVDQSRSEVYGDYLGALARLKADDKVWGEWLRWNEQESQNNDVEHQNDGARDTDSMPSMFAKSLLQAGDPRHAWMVVAESGIQPKLAVQEHCFWLDLLDYPEYIIVWPKGMDAVVLEKYDQLLSEAEHIYGVSWTGGEDGRHVPSSDADEDTQLLLSGEL